jgi:RIO kinase 1
MYREGRDVLSADGKTVKANERRTMAALHKKTSYGAKVAHTSWMMYEFSTMEDLWRAGARVPRPYAVSENAILMGYVGEGGRAAPTLHEIDLDSAEAARLFDVVMDNVERMMKHGIVHGDLSAYNILYWDGDITLIDFPQVTDIHANPNAARILQRDLQRVCAYFSARGVRCKPDALAADLWQRHHPTRMQDTLADLSRVDAGDEEEEA